MEDEALLETIKDIFNTLFLIEPEDVTLDTSKDNLGAWDSLQQVNLVMELEMRFAMHLSPDEIDKMNNVRAIIDILHAAEVKVGK